MKTIKDNLSFPDAMKAVNDGGLVTRTEWGSEFVFRRPSDQLPVQMVTDTVKSLPSEVKQYYKEKYKGETHYAGGAPIEIDFHSYLCKKDPNDGVENGWTPDQRDISARDWMIISPEPISAEAPADKEPKETTAKQPSFHANMAVADIKELRLHFDVMAQAINKYMIGELLLGPVTCQRAENAIQSLFLAKAWLGKMLGELGEPTPYANDGERKSTADIKPTAQRAGEEMLEKARDVLSGKNATEAIDVVRQYISEWIDGFRNKGYDHHSELPVTHMFKENFLTHAHEARFHLGFTMEALKESEEEENDGSSGAQ